MLQIKGKEFTFTIAETMLVPNSERFGVMLKTISEEYLPKRIDLVTEPEEKEGECPVPCRGVLYTCRGRAVQCTHAGCVLYTGRVRVVHV